MGLERRAFLATTLGIALLPLLDSMLAIEPTDASIDKCGSAEFPGRDLGRIDPGSVLVRAKWAG